MSSAAENREPEDREEINIVPALERIMLERGIGTWRALAELLGISEGYMSDIRHGRKIGKRKLVNFAERLGVSVEFLLGGQVLIPMLSLVTARKHFDLTPQAKDITLVDITNFPGLSLTQAQEYYALKAMDDSFRPAFKAGDVLIVKHRSSHLIVDGDKVVYREEGAAKCSIKILTITDDVVVVEGLGGGPSKVRTRDVLAQMDKIMYVSFCPSI